MKRALNLLVVMTCLLLAACAVNPVTGSRNFTLMSEADEMRKGQQAAVEIGKVYEVYDDLPALQNYVTEIGQKLAKNSHRPQLDYHFTVVDSPEVNAFALPGGHIYVTRGILAYLNSEAELAAVLGHEIGHVTARHSVQQYSAATAANVAATVGGIAAAVFLPQMGGQLAQGIQSLLGLGGNVLLSGYGRSHELEADRLGDWRSKPSLPSRARPMAALAVKSPLGNNAENYLRLLNGHYPVGEPVPGKPSR